MKLKNLLYLLALTVSFSATAEAQGDLFAESMTADRLSSSYDEMKTISTGLYFGGGVASVFLGWGIGHAVQGRYAERGWIFTAGGALFYAGLIGWMYSAVSTAAENSQTGSAETISGPQATAFLGIALLGSGLRIWEMIDAFLLPSNYKVVRESPFQIQPVAFYNKSDLNFGLSLNYKF